MRTRILSFFIMFCFIFAAAAPASFSKGKDNPKKASSGIVKSAGIANKNTANMDSSKTSTRNKTMHANSNKVWSKTHSKKHSTTMKNKTTKKDTNSTKKMY